MGSGSQTPNEIRDSTDILFTINPEGINTEASSAWSAQKMSLILQGKLLSGHQVTVEPPVRNKWCRLQAELLYAATRPLRFSGLLNTPVRSDCFKCKWNRLLLPPPRQ